MSVHPESFHQGGDPAAKGEETQVGFQILLESCPLSKRRRLPRREATPTPAPACRLPTGDGDGGTRRSDPEPLSQRRLEVAPRKAPAGLVATPCPGPLLSLACLRARFLRATPAGAGQGSGRSARRPRAPHAHLRGPAHRRGPPHLRRRHKVPASSVRSELGCAPDRLGAAPPPCPAPRPPAPPGAGGAQLRGG